MFEEPDILLHAWKTELSLQNNSSQYRMIFFYFINSDLFIALSKHVLCEIGSQQSHPKLFLHEDHV